MVAVDLLAFLRVLQDPSVSHHGAADALGAVAAILPVVQQLPAGGGVEGREGVQQGCGARSRARTWVNLAGLTAGDKLSSQMKLKRQERTLVVHAPPAVAPGVATQPLVLPPGGVAGPLQDRDVLQEPLAEFGAGDPSPHAVGAALKQADEIGWRPPKQSRRTPPRRR